MSGRWRGVVLAMACGAMAGCDRYHEQPQCGTWLTGEPGPQWELGADGTARQRDAGLTWYRCNAGERFAGGACVGQALHTTRAEAAQYAADFSAASGRRWRLPTVDEMRGLRLEQCRNPAVDTRVFPSVRSDHYWAGEAMARNEAFACSVYTYNLMAQCRDDPRQARLFWLVLDR